MEMERIFIIQEINLLVNFDMASHMVLEDIIGQIIHILKDILFKVKNKE